MSVKDGALYEDGSEVTLGETFSAELILEYKFRMEHGYSDDIRYYEVYV